MASLCTSRRWRKCPKPRKRLLRLFLHWQLLGADPASQCGLDGESILEREVPLAESSSGDRRTTHAGHLGQPIVAPFKIIQHPSQFRHRPHCARNHNPAQGVVVRITNLIKERAAPYRPGVADGRATARFDRRGWVCQSNRAISGNVLLDKLSLMRRHTGLTAAFIVECIETNRPLPQVATERKRPLATRQKATTPTSVARTHNRG